MCLLYVRKRVVVKSGRENSFTNMYFCGRGGAHNHVVWLRSRFSPSFQGTFDVEYSEVSYEVS